MWDASFVHPNDPSNIVECTPCDTRDGAFNGFVSSLEAAYAAAGKRRPVLYYVAGHHCTYVHSTKDKSLIGVVAERPDGWR